jgi:hypothetical protein
MQPEAIFEAVLPLVLADIMGGTGFDMLTVIACQ